MGIVGFEKGGETFGRVPVGNMGGIGFFGNEMIALSLEIILI